MCCVCVFNLFVLFGGGGGGGGGGDGGGGVIFFVCIYFWCNLVGFIHLDLFMHYFFICVGSFVVFDLLMYMPLRRNLDYQDVLDSLAAKGIAIRVASPKLVMEEVCTATYWI